VNPTCEKCGKVIATDEKFVRLREDRTVREMKLAHAACAPESEDRVRVMSDKHRATIAEYISAERSA
jgi:hypothetical protein